MEHVKKMFASQKPADINNPRLKQINVNRRVLSTIWLSLLRWSSAVPPNQKPPESESQSTHDGDDNTWIRRRNFLIVSRYVARCLYFVMNSYEVSRSD